MTRKKIPTTHAPTPIAPMRVSLSSVMSLASKTIRGCVNGTRPNLSTAPSPWI